MKNHLILFCFFLALVNLSFGQKTEKLLLSGTGNDNTRTWDFYCTAGRNSGKWTTIQVPSCWELQGFGKYDYGFVKDSLQGKEQGFYKYSFPVPSDWLGKKVNIVFEGSMTDTRVKINGVEAGPVHQGSYYAFKYDISGMLKYGAANLLEATVSKHSANESVNAAERRADFWLFGGIFRPVYLEALPTQHIANVAIDAKADGRFTAKVMLSGGSDKVSVQVFTPDGKKWGYPFIQTVLKNADNALLTHRFTTPLCWSAESPNLYSAEFTLYRNGKQVHVVNRKFGFRTVEVKERDGIYVNGVKIRFKGVNRHSFWPSSGRTTSNKLSVEDVLLMKEMNMNAVRMSHYPPDGHFLDACDSLGLFVMDELAGWHGHYDTPTGTKLVKEMLEHDVNHPSVVFWANGNEGGHNRDLDPLFGQEDIQQRPVIHPWELFGGIDTQHYREYNYGIGNYMLGHDIVMPTEFLHGMYDGGHGAGLEDYWNEMWNNPLSAGGFLWDFADQGVVRTDKDGIIDTDGNHAADGIIGPYHEKEGSFYAIKQIWSPVIIEHREILPGFDGTLSLENRYSFTNLKSCGFTWKLEKFGGIKNPGQKEFLTGTAVSPDIKPFEKGKLRLSLPANWKNYDALYITATDPFKREIFTWSFPLTLPQKMAEQLVPEEGPDKVKMVETDSVFNVSANGINFLIDKLTGLLIDVRNPKGSIPFNHGPVLQEGVNNFGKFSSAFQGKNLVISSAFDRKKSYNTLQWTIFPSGWIKLKVNYFPAEYFTTLTGVNFNFPEAFVKKVEWIGNGPYRVWKNRLKGNRLGFWEKDYNNTATGENPLIYPEFKGYHSNLYWCKLITTSQPVTVVAGNEDIFLRLFTPKFSQDPYNTTVPFPSGDISFMQGISGIGTKTQKAETTGPMGMKHIYYDFEKDPVRAKELVLYFDFSGE